MARDTYDHARIEERARAKWKELGLYITDLADDTKEKYYLLFEFPYPSGDLHIGHWYAFALTDIFARKLRMEGKNVLFPMGFDAFGLPAENAAIKHGLDPKKWTYENMERMRAQIDTMGASMDWTKEVVTCDPSYYRWTQWLFAKLYEHGLAERKEAPVKWCPHDQTVLANEQVVDGKCERCGHEVEERNLTQWFFKITQYAERLLQDLEPLPWREEIKDAQRAWIGESEGAKLRFPLSTIEDVLDDGTGDEPAPELPAIEVFTTRPDTLFGATYIVLAPEHPLLYALLPSALNAEDVRAYQRETAKKTERERSENKEKTGVELAGILATNPATGQLIPVYVADYVLASYGTGAVMAVPAHDERDFEFAKKYGLPIKQVIEPVFVATGGEDAYRPGEETVHREAVCAVVRNPKDDSYLCVSWKGMVMRGQVTGGIEDGEDIVDAARREVLEETGYKNLKHIERPDYTINTKFWHRLKGVNRHAHFHYVFFELENDERAEVAAEEAALHEVVWVPARELKEFFTVFEGEFIADLIERTDLLYTGDGILKDSGDFSERENREAMWDIVAHAGGERTKQFRIRDWLVSRQRYWGCPIPVVYDPEGHPHLVPAEHLPWLLPEDVDFTPGAAGAGASPLSTSKELKERVERIFGEGWTPEYDTLDTFVDSSWYFLRYLDPKDEHEFSDQALMKKWLPVDRYSGGSEHTTMHLLYARFFQKALYDLALVPTPEPFNERFNRGLIMGPDGQKMSKSKGNVVNPDDVVATYGADAVRMYLAFIGPYNEPGSYPWNLDGAHAMRRFLDRVYALFERMDSSEPSGDTRRALATAITKVSEDIDKFKYNTAISSLMVLVRELESLPRVPKEAQRTLLILLAPFAPHLADELWETLGESGSVHEAGWPAADASLLAAAHACVVVQVNGKRRGELTLAADASEEEALAAARELLPVAAALKEGELKRVIYVPGRILNLVI